MTERLANLLRQQADTLDVPTPDTHGIVAGGRQLRRRRRVAEGFAMVAVAAIVAGVAIAAPRLMSAPTSDLPAASAAELAGWAVASGSTVQLGTGQIVDVDGKVKSLYYTSAGVLVRTGAQATTDAADSTYTLVDAEGETTDFALELGDRVPGTDPTQPYLAYAEKTDDPKRWDVIVRDVRTGEVAQTIPVTGAFTWGGWIAPPVSLSGSHVYVGMDEVTLDVDLQDSTVSPSPLPPSFMPTVAGGREVTFDDRANTQTIVDAQTGAVLLRRSQAGRLLSLSPDGRHALAVSSRICDDDNHCTFDNPTAIVYNLATGAHHEINVRDASYGWTPAGDLLRVDEDSVDVCAPDTEKCHSTPVDVDGRDLRLGGTSYEA